MLSAEQRQEIRKRWEKITPGEWYFDGYYFNHECGEVHAGRGENRKTIVTFPKAELDITVPNADFIAHSWTDIDALLADCEEMEKALLKINEIRNSIVGYQSFGFSEHAYPLVAALEEVGIRGEGYEEANAKAKDQLTKIADLTAKLTALEQENERLRLENAQQAELLNFGM